jgi:hypothetical protein
MENKTCGTWSTEAQVPISWTISNTRPRFNSSQGYQFGFGGSSGNYLQNSQLQHSTQQFQHFSQ